MCGRIAQSQAEIDKIIRLDEREQKRARKQHNIGIGEYAIVSHANGIEQIKFGFNRGGRLNFNGRAEGFGNKDNELHYTGRLGIHTNPNYKESFTNSRCLIPVTSFLEGPEKERLSKPYKISLNYTDVFMLAGLIGVDEKYGDNGFSIITCWPNEIIKEVIGHHRCPVILDNPDTWETWLNPESDIDELLSFLKPPSNEDLEIVEIDPRYKSAKYDTPY